jgi:hypothetical protein
MTVVSIHRTRPVVAGIGRVIIALAVQEELKSLGAPPQIGEM